MEALDFWTFKFFLLNFGVLEVLRFLSILSRFSSLKFLSIWDFQIISFWDFRLNFWCFAWWVFFELEYLSKIIEFWRFRVFKLFEPLSFPSFGNFEHWAFQANFFVFQKLWVSNSGSFRRFTKTLRNSNTLKAQKCKNLKTQIFDQNSCKLETSENLLSLKILKINLNFEWIFEFGIFEFLDFKFLCVWKKYSL